MNAEPPIDAALVHCPAREADFGRLGPVPRLGLATRGNGNLDRESVLEAVRRGIAYLNWCGRPDGMSAAVRAMGEARRRVLVAAQLEARSAERARRELRDLLGELGTEWIDVLTYYYVESEEEWREITAARGAAEAIEDARRAGWVRAIGVTSHQRKLAASIARSGRADMLMVRYNAAHTGAERDVFPAARDLGLPVVTYTALRWGALLEPTPEDPLGFRPPPPLDWYRFALCHPAVSVVLVAPANRAELDEDFALLDDWRGFTPAEYRALREHGERVRKWAGAFP